MTTVRDSSLRKDVFPDDEEERQARPQVDVLVLWREQRKEEQFVSDVKPTPQGKKDADPLEKLAASEDESDQRAAEVLKALAESDSDTDKQDAARLVKMLGNEKERALAISLLTNTRDAETRHQFFTIADDPKLATAAAKVTELLINAAQSQDAPYTAGALLAKLQSTDKDEQSDGKKLLEMINDPKQQADGIKLLELFSFDANSLHGVISMMNDPARKQDVQDIMSLLKSDSRAGVALVRMSLDTDATVTADRKVLVAMLKDDKTRTAALDIMANLDSPQHVHQMLELLKDPQYKRVTDKLLAGLHAEEGELSDPVVQTLLGLLTDQFEPEKTDGKRFLKLLNSEKPEERQSADRLLRSVRDMENRHQLLGMIEDEKTRPGVDRLLELASTGRRREREKWQDIVGNQVDAQSREARISREIVVLLSGDEKQQAAAKTIITHLQGDSERSRLLSMLADPKQKAGAEKLLEWLQGEEKQRWAAQSFLDLNKQQGPEGGFRLRAQPTDEVKEPHPVTEQLLPWLTDKDKAAAAMTLLNQVSNPDQIKALIDGLADPKLQPGCAEVIKMLGSKDQEEQRTAKVLLEMLRPKIERRNELSAFTLGMRPKTSDTVDTSALKLMTMLADPKEKATARAILSLEDANDRRALMFLLEGGFGGLGKERMDLGQRVLKVIAEKNNGAGVAGSMLRNLSTEELKVALDLMDTAKSDPKAPGAAAFSYMIRDRNPAAYALTRQLASYDPASRQFGNEMLAKLDTRQRWDTESQLNLGLSPKDLQLLQSLLAERSTRDKAHELLRLLQSEDRSTAASARVLLGKMEYGKPEQKKDGTFLFDMLDPKNKDAQALVKSLLSANLGYLELTRLSQALQNPAERKSAEALIKLLNIPRGDDAFGRNSARSLLDSLSFAGEKTPEHAAATKLFHMLGDEKQAALAEAMINSLPTFEQQKICLQLIESGQTGTEEQKELSKALTALLLSKERKDLAAVERLMELLTAGRLGSPTAPPEVGKDLLKMLADPGRRADAIAILSKMENAQQCATFTKLLADKTTAPAAKAMLALLKSDRSEESVGVVDLIRRLTPDRFASGRGSEFAQAKAEQLVKALGDPATADSAQKALRLIRGEESVDVFADMIASESGRKDIDKLHAMLALGDEQKRLATGIPAMRSAAEIHLALEMLADPQQKDAAQELIEMLNNNDDFTGRQAARRVMALLTNANAAERQAGQQLLAMIRSSDMRATGILLGSRMRGVSMKPIMDIFADKNQLTAAGEIEDLLKDEDNRDERVVERLATLLDSKVAAEAAEGRRLLSMLNDSSTKYTAIRILRRGVARSPFDF